MRCLPFAGVDLVCDSGGRWQVLEVNDHPNGLFEADRLSRHPHAAFAPNGGAMLAASLASRGRRVALLLPECFQLDSPICAEPVDVCHAIEAEEPRVGGTLDLFNELLRCLHADGVDA